MIGPNSKSDPAPIIRAHWESYRDPNTGRRVWRDYIVFTIPPFLVFGASLFFDVRLGGVGSAALLTVSGLLGAFLFGVMLQIYERAYGLEDAPGGVTKSLATQALNLEQLAANAAYAALVCILAAAVFVVTSVTTGTWLRTFTALGLLFTVHYGLVLLMVMRRLFLRTQVSLERVRTGVGRSRRRAA